MDELKPCPFCGGKPWMTNETDEDGCYWSRVKCACGVATRGKWASSSANTCPQFYAEVRAGWNTRPRDGAGVVDEWRPIETAPRDGTRVLLAWDGVRVGYYLDNSRTARAWAGWKVPSMESWPPGQPTHWRPLPQPPALAAALGKSNG